MIKIFINVCLRKMLKLKIIMSFNILPMEMISSIVCAFNRHFLLSIPGSHTLNINSGFSSSISYKFNLFN